MSAIDPDWKASMAAVGITNQRETTILWDGDTGKPLYDAIRKCVDDSQRHSSAALQLSTSLLAPVLSAHPLSCAVPVRCMCCGAGCAAQCGTTRERLRW
jgi:hypothetical protein